MCRPKEFRERGIDHLRERNLELLGKWLWRFFDENGSLWQSIIRNKYGVDSNGWDFSHNMSPNMSLLWSQITKLYPLFLPHIQLVVGNGKSIHFWEDIWWGEQYLSITFPRLFRLSNQRNVVIADVLFPCLCSHS